MEPAHSAHEHIKIAQLDQGIQIYALMMLSVLGKGE
jgi:acetylornithine deacetylase/succinyl-diaminopimelate desuccinylase-like protein